MALAGVDFDYTIANTSFKKIVYGKFYGRC